MFFILIKLIGRVNIKKIKCIMNISYFSFIKNKIMTELKTKKNDSSVDDFLNKIVDDQKRKDSFEMVEMMREITDAEPKMWGGSIIGFGDYHYKYASGREGDWFQVGFSPRKQNLTLYLMGYHEGKEVLFKGLGKYKTGKACIYIKKLDDIDRNVLENLIRESIKKE